MNKARSKAILLSIAAAFSVLGTSLALAGSNICPNHVFTWGENIGWMNWRDAENSAQGVHVYANHLKGFIWCENIGWVNVGSCGGPYANTDHTNFGVNIGAGGVLSGYAWAENVGWINFGTEPVVGAQGARFDETAGRFTGYAWGENIGWVNLDNSTRFAAALPADVDGNGIVDVNDLTFVVLRIGQSVCSDANADGSATVDVNDLTYVVLRLGSSCPL